MGCRVPQCSRALTIETAVLILFNGIIVALATNGGFEALSKMFPSLFKSSGNHQ